MLIRRLKNAAVLQIGNVVCAAIQIRSDVGGKQNALLPVGYDLSLIHIYGMPVVCRVAIKPTASIAKEQKTISLANQTDTALVVKGRHDPCIVQRAVPVIEAAMAIGLTDLLLAYAGRTGWKTI